MVYGDSSQSGATPAIIDASLDRERLAIHDILEAYQVPLDTVSERISSTR
jgi:hypothetical protein